MLLRNKIGGEKLLSIWWILTLVMVALVIAWGVASFYSAEVDVKKIEAEILANRISDCFFEQGLLIDNLLKNDFDIFYECKLNREVIESSFYFKISVLDEQDKKIREDIEVGFLEGVCTTKDAEGCIKKVRGVVYEQNNKIKKGRLEILATSNQVGNSLGG